MTKLLLNTVFPFIVASHCVTLTLLALIRNKRNILNLEYILFSLFCLAIGFWGLSPFLIKFNKAHLWISTAFLITISSIYIFFITNKKYIKISLFFVIASISLLYTSIHFKFHLYKNYPFYFSLLFSPYLITTFLILLHYYIQYKSHLHLNLLLLAFLMSICGILEIIKVYYLKIDIPFSTFGGFLFLAITIPLIIQKGYLQKQGWIEYIRELKKREKLLAEKYIILKKAKLDAVTVLSQTIEAKDKYTKGHCVRVKKIAKTIGEEMKLNEEKLLFLEYGSLLHDIGKIGIPEKILKKPSSLTKEEFEIIKNHPDIGANILKTIDYFSPIIPMIKYHHENFDGTGYPEGLKGYEIPLEARILSISDKFDALTSKRPYRDAYTIPQALNIIQEISGTQLDPEIVNLFIEKKIYNIKKDKFLILKIKIY